MRTLGYSYDASIMCPACAVADFTYCRLVWTGGACVNDEHGLPEALEDRYGDPVRPVFSTDEGAADEVCGSCLERLSAHAVHSERT